MVVSFPGTKVHGNETSIIREFQVVMLYCRSVYTFVVAKFRLSGCWSWLNTDIDRECTGWAKNCTPLMVIIRNSRIAGIPRQRNATNASQPTQRRPSVASRLGPIFSYTASERSFSCSWAAVNNFNRRCHHLCDSGASCYRVSYAEQVQSPTSGMNEIPA